jgi:hypothetical protein
MTTNFPAWVFFGKGWGELDEFPRNGPSFSWKHGKVGELG